MQKSLLDTAYLTEDGYIFEAGNAEDLSQLLKIISKASSTSEAKANLNKKGIYFTLYKVAEASVN